MSLKNSIFFLWLKNLFLFEKQKQASAEDSSESIDYGFLALDIVAPSEDEEFDLGIDYDALIRPDCEDPIISIPVPNKKTEGQAWV